MNKKCTTCGEKKPHKEFNKNRVSSDGLSSQCKQCINEKQKGKRRSLQYMLRRVPVSMHIEFENLWMRWSELGFPPHAKPVVFAGANVMTLIELRKKGTGKRGVSVEKCTPKGQVIATFASINEARKSTGVSHSYVRWSIDNKQPIGGYLWRKKKRE